MAKTIVTNREKKSRPSAKRENFIVLDVRGDLQAVDLSDLDRHPCDGRTLVARGNPFVGRKLQEALTAKVNLLTVSLRPVARGDRIFEITQRTLPDF